MPDKVCPEEPDKKFENSICYKVYKAGEVMCEATPEKDKKKCLELLNSVVEGELDGKTAQEKLKKLIGAKAYEAARKKALSTIEGK
jgi:hypothetical protein